jgi:hypothetical protein
MIWQPSQVEGQRLRRSTFSYFISSTYLTNRSYITTIALGSHVIFPTPNTQMVTHGSCKEEQLAPVMIETRLIYRVKG